MMLAEMAISKKKVLSVKGAEQSIARAKVGRTFKEFDMVARELGTHINDCGQEIFSELSRKNGHKLNTKKSKANTVSRNKSFTHLPPRSRALADRSN